MQGLFFKEFKNSYIPEILKEIYIEKVYEPHLKGKKDLIMADFGANIGLWTYYASQFAKKLYAVEPTKAHFDCLTELVKYNKLTNVVTIQKAISHKNETTFLYHNGNTTANSLMSKVQTSYEPEKVKTIRLDKFFTDNKIEYLDFLKVDIEGAEPLVFGCDAFDIVKDKIGIIMGEFHDWSNFNPNQFASCFRDRGFSFNWTNNTDATLFIAQRKK